MSAPRVAQNKEFWAFIAKNKQTGQNYNPKYESIPFKPKQVLKSINIGNMNYYLSIK